MSEVSGNKRRKILGPVAVVSAAAVTSFGIIKLSPAAIGVIDRETEEIAQETKRLEYEFYCENNGLLSKFKWQGDLRSRIVFKSYYEPHLQICKGESQASIDKTREFLTCTAQAFKLELLAVQERLPAGSAKTNLLRGQLYDGIYTEDTAIDAGTCAKLTETDRPAGITNGDLNTFVGDVAVRLACGANWDEASYDFTTKKCVWL